MPSFLIDKAEQVIRTKMLRDQVCNLYEHTMLEVQMLPSKFVGLLSAVSTIP